MTKIVSENTVFFRHFSELRETFSDPAWLADVRESAIASFDAQGIPTVADEEWRFTNLAEFARIEFQPVRPASITLDQVATLPIWQIASPRCVFVDGVFSPELSEVSNLPQSVKIGSLRETIASGVDVSGLLAKIAPAETRPFVALNTALWRDGLYVHAETSQEREVVPQIFVIYLSTGQTPAGATHIRNLIIVERGAKLRLAEVFCALTPQLYFTNPVSEVLVSREAEFEHYRIQLESTEAYHLGAVQARVGGHASYSLMEVALGGRLSRSDLGIEFFEPESVGILNGLFFLGGSQHADFHTVIDHAKPYCESHELVKGILRDHARGVFNGRIIVRPDAQRTNAKQTNKNLLLSRTALVNTNPQLEIFADDVKCTHGATVGHLDETQLFYLRARGISEQAARSLLTYAFANDVLRRIAIQPLRELLESEILAVEHMRVDADLLEAL